MKPVTYNLRENNTDSSEFYKELRYFTYEVMYNPMFDCSHEVSSFIEFSSSQGIKAESFEETCMEYITIGVLVNEHAGKATKSNKVIIQLAKKLYQIRKKNTNLKPYADSLRGYINTLFLSHENKKYNIFTYEDLNVLIDWLEATGEYREESVKLRNWSAYLQGLSVEEGARFLKKACYIGNIFKKEAQIHLGAYTKNVESFREKELSNKKYKEDYLFCGRSEVEYHLNMVCAYVMNQNLKNDFNKTSQKILLLPTCMSSPADGKCKSFSVGNKRYCSGCTDNCKINIYRKQCKSKGVLVNLIPHSSSFSKFLKEWENQKDVGLIGVACVLNLMTGGYEMKKLNIPSQCIFLDYCGCKKHWSKEGIATDININLLDKMLTESERKMLFI